MVFNSHLKNASFLEKIVAIFFHVLKFRICETKMAIKTEHDRDFKNGLKITISKSREALIILIYKKMHIMQNTVRGGA